MVAREGSLREHAAVIAQQLGRPEKDVLGQLGKLDSHWIHTVGDWHRLSEKRRLCLGLPVLLISSIDGMVEEIMGSRVAIYEPTLQMEVRKRSKKHLEIVFSGSQQSVDVPLSALVSDAIALLFPDEREDDIVLLKENGDVIHHSDSCISSLVGTLDIRWKSSASRRATLESTYLQTPVDRWLSQCGLHRYAHSFFQHGIEDLRVVPLLKEEIITQIAGVDDARLLRCSGQLRRLKPSHFASYWLECCGLPSLLEIFEKEKITLSSLFQLDAWDFERFGVPRDTAQEICDMTLSCCLLSSVRETYDWLNDVGFGNYAVQFAKSNVPYYLLPFLNYFAIFEMGIAIDDLELFTRLRELINSPTFQAKAVGYWLRDMGADHYINRFADAGWVTLDDFMQLTAEDLDVILPPHYRRNCVRCIAEMKDYKMFFEVTSSILQELGEEKYSELFALHGISIDVFPLLTEAHLMQMGVADPKEKEKVLGVVQDLQRTIAEPDRRDLKYNAIALSWRQRHGIEEAGAQLPFDQPDSFALRQLSGSGAGQGSGKKRAMAALGSESIGDTKSIDEWLAFLSDGPSSSGSKKKKKKKKKNKKKKKKNNATKVEAVLLEKEEASTPQPECQDATAEEVVESPAEVVPPVETLTDNVCQSQSILVKTVPRNSVADGQADLRRHFDRAVVLDAPFTSALQTGKGDFGFGHSPLDKDAYIKAFSPELKPLEEMMRDAGSSDDEMDPALKAELDAEVEAFRLRLESTHDKSKLTPIFFLPD